MTFGCFHYGVRCNILQCLKLIGKLSFGYRYLSNTLVGCQPGWSVLSTLVPPVSVSLNSLVQKLWCCYVLTPTHQSETSLCTVFYRALVAL